MKKPFDRIVGPDGEWKDDEARTLFDLDDREEFVLRCLNAAVNLYGIITREEFVSLYNGYAKDHDAPLSAPLTLDELDRFIDFFLCCPGADPESPEEVALEPAVWFVTIPNDHGDSPEIVYYDLAVSAMHDASSSPKAVNQTAEQKTRLVWERLREIRASFRDLPLHILPEEDFLCYEDPLCAEETKESLAFEKFIRKEYRLRKEVAEIDVMGMQSRLRITVATIVQALEYIRDVCNWRPSDHDAFVRLINAISPLVGTTRTWNGRGRTTQELVRMGVCPKYEREDIYDVFDLEGSGRDDDADDWDETDSDDVIQPEDIPLSVYNGPIDFKFVKDAVRRDEKLAVYEDVRQVTSDFVCRCVMREQMQEERHQAAVRLGFLKEGEGLERLDLTLDCVVGDFASMMDDQGDGPAIRRVLARKDKLDEIDARAASYYANYRYTWLEILAMKAGVGLKCRDLLTGEELFLMEKSLSCTCEKGMTICVGIAPMEDVYIIVGVSAPARFENPATILKIVLTHLGLPTELPIRLNAADQARFAAETIRRIHANGNFSRVLYGA